MASSFPTASLLFMIGLLYTGCTDPSSAQEEIYVYAAASTAEVMRDVMGQWNAHQKVKVHASFASSSTLAQQITQGAPAQLYLSANTQWMDHLERQGLLKNETRTPLLTGRLVLIEPATAPPQSWDGWPTMVHRLGGGHLAIGDPQHVPAGIYAKEALSTLGLWDAVGTRLAPGANVRTALAYVESGEAPLGIVYATDALASDNVRVVTALPTHSHSPIAYTLAMIEQEPSPSAHAFYRHLLSPASRATYARHGFEEGP